MKPHSVQAIVASALLLLFLLIFAGVAAAQGTGSTLIYESRAEFFGAGDFDGDGRRDVIIVDKETGKFRLGYQTTAGVLTWVDNRFAGFTGVAGFSIGKLFTNNADGLAFTSPDANQLSLVSALSVTAPSKPVVIPFDAALGPHTVIAVDIGGAGNTSLADLYVGSIYNSPDPNLAALLRYDGSALTKIADAPLTGTPGRGNRIALKRGEPELACVLVTGDSESALQAKNLGSGNSVDAAVAGSLPNGSDYTCGNFRGTPLAEFLFYKPGENAISVQAIEEGAAGRLQFAKAMRFELGEPILRVVTIDSGPKQQLLVIFGEGEKAGVFNFNGATAPVLAETLVATNELLTCAASLSGALITFSHSAGGKFSSRYQRYNLSGSAHTFAAFGGLPSLADNDNVTIPDIHERIVKNLDAKNAGEMKLYTNTIPGTQVTFVMVPIPGGEFVMGSPEAEADRKPDESPQHKVTISPFWMGQCEVTWNEYELFMYPDEEKRTRATLPTDADGDKLADAVTHPSKPYVEMSFGMGKDNFPAISMTQHGANKYCQWLSAKTGQFYRLPTEAEWEYACRAGTTTTYFFGEDASKLGEYAWFEQNSDFKYQKVRKKKPNPWGLYDIYGNVVEWVLDQYDPEFYQQCAGQGTLVDPWNKAVKAYPHSVRGGSWDDPIPRCRSAARRGSDRAWKMQDPQLPKSVWYHSDAQFVGFRIVRPLKVPPPEQLQKYWTSGVEKD